MKPGFNEVNWEQVVKRGACFVGGGFLVGCGISLLTSTSKSSVNFSFISWPVLFSTGVGMGLACVSLENELLSTNQDGRTLSFRNPGAKMQYLDGTDIQGKYVVLAD